MHLLPMYPALRNAFSDYCNKKTITNIKAASIADTEDFLINVLSHNLCEGKTTLVVSDNDKDPAWLAKLMSTYALSQYCFVWSQEYLSKQKPMERIHQFAYGKEIEFDYNYYKVLVDQYEDQMSIIKEKIAVLTQDVMNQYSWKELLAYNIKSGGDTERWSKELLPSDWSESNLNQMIGDITLAESQFHEKFILLDNINLFHDELYNEEFELDLLNEELNALRGEITEISSLYADNIGRVRKSIKASIQKNYIVLKDEVSKLSKKIERLTIKAGKQDPKNIALNVICTNKEYDVIQDIVLQIQKRLYETNTLKSEFIQYSTQDSTLQDLVLAGHSLAEKIEVCYQGIDQKVNDQIRRMGPFNLEDPGLEALEDRLNSYLNKINRSQIFKRQYLNNSLTFDNRITLVRELEQDIYKGIIFLETFPDYHEWKQGLRDEVCNKLIDKELRLTSEPWVSASKKLVVNHFLNKHFSPELTTLDADIKSLLSQERDLYHIQLQLIHAISGELRINATQRLKNTNEYLYKQLFGSSVNKSIDVLDLLAANNQLFTSFFPVILTSSSNTHDLTIHLRQKWDSVIVLGNCPETLDFSERSGQMVKISGNDNTSDGQRTCLQLPKGSRYHAHTALSNIPKSDRHREAMMLSEAIVASVDAVSIFQMRDTTIISVLDKEIEEIISTEFIPQGIKCLHHKTNDATAVTEALVNTDCNLFFLHENGMLNMEALDDISWQNHLLEQVDLAGLTRMPIYCSDLYIDKIQLLKSVRQTILAPVTSEMVQSEAAYVNVSPS